MLSCSLLAVALLAAPAASASVFAESAARLWLSQHGAPKRDELAELRTANPEAYAIVNALLSKKALGLLDPKHPRASFSKEVPVASADQEASSWRQLLASPGEQHQAEVQTAPHRDWLNWKPQNTADDDVMVQNVLGSVSDLHAEVQPAPRHDWLNWKPQSATDDAVMVKNMLGPVADVKDNTASLLSHSYSQQATPPVIDTVATKREIPEAALVKESGGNLDLDVKWWQSGSSSLVNSASEMQPRSWVQSSHGRRQGAINSNPATVAAAYLTGLDLTGNSDAPAAYKKSTPKKSLRALSTSSNVLQSFSWNDDDKRAMEEGSKSKFMAPGVKKSLISWLDDVHNEPEAQKSQRQVHSSYSSDPKVLEKDQHLLQALLH
jgi:hypothetical protein